ncbi:calcium sensor EFh [Actinorhabdospora filicis]|uniref:Calcium sensor EFh n=1 Tax=Actinorhabdospora filicis TaxID=1785913 RepID=A0A9W6SLM4_9ACTN|nr:EF-hand domain-containing protein [Actinorhabdospora filicis]GLZ78009.1 calcium sensor EFh [Actinorhabdospora filicis]
MTSTLLNRKLGRHFDLIDTNGDGKIDQADFDLIVTRLSQEFGQAPGTPKHRALTDAYAALWSGMQQSMDLDSDGAVSREEYVRGLESNAAAAYQEYLAPVARAILDFCDVDGDGRISGAELAGVHRGLGMAQHAHDAAMRTLDLDGSGYVDEAELTQAIKEFFSSNDPQSRGNDLFGEL